MTNKFLTAYNDTAISFKGANYSFESRINSAFDELTQWATPQINERLFANHLLSKREWSLDIESYDPITRGQYGILKSPLTLDQQNQIKINAVTLERSLGQATRFIIFNSALVPYAYRFTTTGIWYYIMGSITGWEDITYDKLLKIRNSANKDKTKITFIWKIGEYIFSSDSSNILEPICALVTGTYCDKHVPKSANKTALAKVSYGGFGFITYFLSKYLGQITTRYQIRTQFERLDKVSAIPFVPTQWQPNLELIKTDKLEKIAGKLLDEVSDDKTGEDKILDAMSELKQKINDELKGTNDDSNWLYLSEILDAKLLLQSSKELWSDEFMVNIDTTIVCTSLEIPEDNILLGVLSWGVLELLVEDNTLPDDDLDSIEKELELECGIPISILTVSSDKGQELLEKMDIMEVTKDDKRT